MTGYGGKDWEGAADRTCGRHRTTGTRAWCYDCGQWCRPKRLCPGCDPVVIAVLTKRGEHPAHPRKDGSQ
jgi:hypothetical protein